MSVDAFLNAARPPAVIVVRVTTTPDDQWRTTVQGRTIRLPSLERVLARCRAMPFAWAYRFIKGFDADFFLPTVDGEVGLLLASATTEPMLPGGFEPLVRLSQS